MEPEFVPAGVKQEPPEEFLLILPTATEDEPGAEPFDVKRQPSEESLLVLPPATKFKHEAEQEIVPAEVKREPSEEFVLILPPATEDEPEHAEVVISKQKRPKKLACPLSVFKCDQCAYQTDKKRNLTDHKRIHNKQKSCETCQKNFSTNQILKRHQMQHKHGNYATAAEETFDCNKCDKSFNTRDHLGQHQRKVHDENEVKCEVCGKICKNRALLHNHSQSHVKVKCLTCHKMIFKSSMSAHMLTHSTQKPFECDLCEHSSKTKENLKRHIERAHLLRRLVNDSKCQIDFSDFELLEELQHKHGIVTTTSERKFKCNKCDKAFATLQTLKKHKKRVHAESTFRCEICKKEFKTKGDLKQHKVNVHAKVSCSVCSKKVGQRFLKAHMKLHLPGHHFECDFCGFKSVRKQNLLSHIYRRHRREALKRNFGRRGKLAIA